MHESGNGGILKGVIWKLLERFGVQGTQFILQVVLARILSPEHYGVLSLMIIFTTLANVFIQTGFNSSLIQNKDVTDEDYSSVFWVTLGIAALMYGIIFLTAPSIAQFYRMDAIVKPLRVLALMLIPGALNSIQIAKISREMDFKQVFISNVTSTVVAGVVGIALALMGAGLWALVAQNILNVTIAAVVMLFTVNWRPRLVCNLDRVVVLFRFGWKLLVSSLLESLYTNLSGLVIGKKYDSDTLAFNNRGDQFPRFIVNALGNSVVSVIFPAMSAVQDDREKVKALLRTSITASGYILFPILTGLAAVASPLISLLLTDKWLPCVPYLQIYCFASTLDIVHLCNLQAINAMGRSDLFLKLEIIKKIYEFGIFAVAVFCFDSPLAIAGVMLVDTVISWYVNAYPNKKLLGYAFEEQLHDLLPIMLISSAMFLIVLKVGQIMQAGALLTLFVQIPVGVCIYVLLSAILKPMAFKMVMEQAKRVLEGRK